MLLSDNQKIYTISSLTSEIKAVLENSWDYIWIKGEISTFRRPSSGHWYFVLKDESAIIKVVMFKMQQRFINFKPSDGKEVVVRGRLSLYEPRGEYQLIIDYMEISGAGERQKAFEELKTKLANEGLFDQGRKMSLPIICQHIGIITSGTGAAIKDILKIFKGSQIPLNQYIQSVRVQGEFAASEIAEAVTRFNNIKKAPDVIIIARGGGSSEDLWAFNEEIVARSISDSKIPIISAVGHEIDFTISDFTADLRAPTPTAGAALILQQNQSFIDKLNSLINRVEIAVKKTLERRRENILSLRARLRDPFHLAHNTRLRFLEFENRLISLMTYNIEKKQTHIKYLGEKLNRLSPAFKAEGIRQKIENYLIRFTAAIKNCIEKDRTELTGTISRLESLSPLAVLARGYSIAYRIKDNSVIKDSMQVEKGEQLQLRLYKGELTCKIIK